MQLTNVSNNETSKAADTQAPAEFKGHYVKDRKVQPTWGEWIARTDLTSLQDDFEKAHPTTDAASPEVSLWKRPFVFMGNALNSVLDLITYAFKTVFCCFFKANESKDEGTAADKKAEPKKAEK